jgi:hypothetical protein
MNRMCAAVFLCFGLFLMMRGEADAGCGGYRGYYHGYPPRASYSYRPNYHGHGCHVGGYYGPGYRPSYNSYYHGGVGYGHYGGRSFISIGFGF